MDLRNDNTLVCVAAVKKVVCLSNDECQQKAWNLGASCVLLALMLSQL